MSIRLKNGELKTTAIRDLVKSHNKAMDWDIKGLKRNEIIALIEKKGYKINHSENKLELTGSQMKRRPKTIKPIKKTEEQLKQEMEKKTKAKITRERNKKKKEAVAKVGAPPLPTEEIKTKVQKKKKALLELKSGDELKQEMKPKRKLKGRLTAVQKEQTQKIESKKKARKELIEGGEQPPMKPPSDKQLIEMYGKIKVKAMNELLDKLPGTNSKGGGSKLSKIKKILKFNGESELKKLIS
jgi:hypothetical protein